MILFDWNAFLKILWSGYDKLLKAEMSRDTANKGKLNVKQTPLWGKDGKNWSKGERPEASKQCHFVWICSFVAL